MNNVRPSPGPGVLATVAGGLGVCLAGIEVLLADASLVPLGMLLLAAAVLGCGIVETAVRPRSIWTAAVFGAAFAVATATLAVAVWSGTVGGDATDEALADVGLGMMTAPVAGALLAAFLWKTIETPRKVS